MPPKEKHFKLILEAFDRFTAPMKAFSSRMKETLAPIREVKGALSSVSKEAGVTLLATRLQGVAHNVSELGGALKDAVFGLGALVTGAAGGVGGLVAFANSTAEAGDNIAKTAARLGLGVEALQEYRYAAHLSGIEQEMFDASMLRFGNRAGESSRGIGEAVKVFSALHIRLKDASGAVRPMGALFEEAVDKLSRIKAPLVRNAMAAKLFGEEGVKMVQMMDEGSAGLQAMREEARKLGGVMSSDLARNSEEFGDTWDRFKFVAIGLRNALGEGLIPALTEFISLLTKDMAGEMGSFRAAVKEFGVGLPEKLVALKDGIVELYQRLRPLASAFMSMAEFLGPANTVLLIMAATIGGPLISAFSALIPAVYALGAALWNTPIGWVAIGLAVVAAAGYGLYRAWKFLCATMPTAWANSWEQIKKDATRIWDGLKAVFAWTPLGMIVNNWGPISDFFKGLWDGISKRFMESVGAIKDTLAGLSDLLPDWIKGGLGLSGSSPARPGAPAGAAEVTQRVREERYSSSLTSTQKSTVRIELPNLPQGSRVRQEGDAPVNLDMGYGMVYP